MEILRPISILHMEYKAVVLFSVTIALPILNKTRAYTNKKVTPLEEENDQLKSTQVIMC